MEFVFSTLIFNFLPLQIILYFDFTLCLTYDFLYYCFSVSKFFSGLLTLPDNF
jgi:hypothetical protein